MSELPNANSRPGAGPRDGDIRASSSDVSELQTDIRGRSLRVKSINPASDESLFYASLGDEQLKRKIPFLNEVLRQLLTLSAAMMGGSIALWNDLRINHGMKIAATACFMGSLIVSLVGILPLYKQFRRQWVNEIRDAFSIASTWKSLFIWIAALFLVCGFLAILFGLAKI